MDSALRRLTILSNSWGYLSAEATSEARQRLYLETRWAVRELALANPLLKFDSILFVKRAPTMFPHMSDQHYGWWSRGGGGVYVLEANANPNGVDTARSSRSVSSAMS